MKFLTEQTSKSIGFKQVWSKINTLSPLGDALKSNTTPFLQSDLEELELELRNLSIIIDAINNNKEIFSEIASLLKGFKDIRGTINNCRYKKAILDDIQLFEIKEALIKTEKIQRQLDKIDLEDVFEESFNNLDNLLRYLSLGQGKSNSFYLADEYDGELARIRNKRRDLEKKLLEYKRKLSSSIEKVSKRPLSNDDEITVNKNDTDLVKRLKESELFSLASENFASLTFRLIEDNKIIDWKQKINQIKSEEESQKKLIRKKITNRVADNSLAILSNLNNIAYLDFLIAKARFSIEINGFKPQITEEDKIEINSGRHLLIEEKLKKKDMSFQEIDIDIKKGSTLITGPNMGGKTVTLKMIALLVAMAQYGLFIPAEKMSFKPRNYIYFSLVSNNIDSGLSKFGSEIVSLKDVIESADKGALILIDEIAHGTNPREGYAIAYSIIRKLDIKNSISVITTHFERLAETLDLNHLQVKGLDHKLLEKHSGLIKEDGIDILNKYMDFSLERVNSAARVPHDAIKVARLLGFDKEILNNAEEIIKNNIGLNGGDF